MLNMNKQKASTLIEVLIAVSVIVLILTSVSAMISMLVRLADSNERKQLALLKAEEALEFFRKERSITSWFGFSTFIEDGARYCISTLPESMASMSAQLGTCEDADVLEAARYQFKREAAIDFDGENRATISIDLMWQDGNKDKNLTIEQNFENY